MKKKVAVINFNNSNIKSIFSALKKIGLQPVLINKKGELHKFENLVLPGVGTFKSGMNYLNKKNLANEIKKFYNDKKKIFAVCLGMQILLENGNEFGKHKGLGLIKGEVIRIKNKQVQKEIEKQAVAAQNRKETREIQARIDAAEKKRQEDIAKQAATAAAKKAASEGRAYDYSNRSNKQGTHTSTISNQQAQDNQDRGRGQQSSSGSKSSEGSYSSSRGSLILEKISHDLLISD